MKKPSAVSLEIPLAEEIREVVDTATAARHLLRQQQTLRAWSAFGGPIRPVRIGRRLGWRTADIKRLLGVEG